MTNLEVSCPCCGKNTVVAMEYNENPATMMLSQLFPDVKVYSWHGETACVCGQLVIASLTVTGGTNDRRN